MIRTSRLMLSLCVVAALAVHGGASWLGTPDESPRMDSGAGATEARLGSSFADMVAGSAKPVSDSRTTPNRQIEDVIEPDRPEQATRPRAEQAGAETPGAEVAETPATPEATRSVLPRDPARRAALSKIAPTLPGTSNSIGSETARAAPAAQPETERAATPEATSATTSREITATRPGSESQSVDTEQDELQVSRRPRTRPAEVEQAASANETPSPEPTARPQGNAGGNAERNANRGSATGSDESKAERAGNDNNRQSANDGNAAASDYPGQVMRKLARVPRPRSSSRGAAIVRFRIAENGDIASIGLARSSGSARLDRAALSVVRRAAPFPGPPRGAQRSFSIRIKGD